MKRYNLLTLAALLAAGAMSAATTDDIIKEVKAAVAPDARQVVFEVALEGDVLRGVTSESSAHDALIARLDAEGIKYVDSLRVYPADHMGLISIPAASLRTRGAHAGEMATQAVMGTPVRILDNSGEWWRVQTPDGYIAWVPSSSVADKTADEFQAWRSNANRMVVTDLWQTHAFTTATANGPRDVVTDLVLSAIVVADGQEANGRIHVTLPDGRAGWADAKSLTPIAEWASQNFDAQKILTTAYSMEGTPYLWGGASTKALDCSGLAKVSYLNNGLILRRDASQQALTGLHLDADDWHNYQAGDLMFFGSKGRVTHVAIYDADGHYVHSSGRVKRNSIDPDAPDYLYSPMWAVRIHGYEGTDGITQAINHPWYFSNN